jgi:hypothetical protein
MSDKIITLNDHGNLGPCRMSWIKVATAPTFASGLMSSTHQSG